MKLLDAQVLLNQALTQDTFSMTVHAPEIAENVHPGQFAMIYLTNGELLLPRPISFSDAGEDTVTFVYQVVGAGTKVMSCITSGEKIKILGPLGKGFFIGSNSKTPQKKVAIVGGGIGVAPLVMLAKHMLTKDTCVDAYLGFRNNPTLTEMFENYANNTFISTEDGSVGHKGNILEVVKSQNTQYDEILACGPRPMLDALAEYANSQNIPCQLSMEERMACGIGTCVGCVLQINGTYLRICTEGPVFYSDSLTHQ